LENWSISSKKKIKWTPILIHSWLLFLKAINVNQKYGHKKNLELSIQGFIVSKPNKCNHIKT